MQRELPILAEIAPPVFLDVADFDHCHTEHDAVLLCWNRRRVKYVRATAADLLGMPHSHLSNILNGKKYPPYDFRRVFQLLCGNWAIRQWNDMQEGFVMRLETPLERENRELKQQLRKAA